MQIEAADEQCALGQFIPAHYHHNMLMDGNRMRSFRSAIEYAVRPGAKVLELGGGTGVLSWFAAAKAEKVWCVEFNPEMVASARAMLAMNPHGERVEVVQADAFHYLPPEPVDVVICEMLYTAMLREKQLELIESFKRRYLARFGGALPVFLPEAVIMAVQPVQQNYHFSGFHAPIIEFQPAGADMSATREIAPPAVYAIVDFNQTNDATITWDGKCVVEANGTVNALRFITKNVLAIVGAANTTIDWLNHFMVLPLDRPVLVKAGDVLSVSFQYRAGASIPSLQASLHAGLIYPVARQAPAQRLACPAPGRTRQLAAARPAALPCRRAPPAG